MMSNNRPFVSVKEFGLLLNHLESARADFVNNGAHSSNTPRVPILSSWQRSKQYGVMTDMQTAPLKYHEIQLREERARRPFLMQTVTPYMEEISATFPSNHTMVVCLSDETGAILDGRYGGNRSFNKSEKTHFLPGADWSETAAGTNGIGTALVCGSPMQVFAWEHYCSGWHQYACSSAPIRDRVSGTILGVLTISGDSHMIEANNLNWVVSQVREIEKNLQGRLEREFPSLFELIFQKIDQPGIIYNQSGRITRMNSLARNMFPSNLVGDSLEIVFSMTNGQGFFNKSNQSFDVVCRRTGQRFIVTTHSWIIDAAHIGGCAFFRLDQAGKKTVKQESLPSGTRYTFSSMVGQSPALRKTIQLAEKVSQCDSPVLITGETGTGKEVLAQSIHNNSRRNGYPFVSMNCAAMPKELTASELFGYEEGSFTGAQRGGRIGKFEAANGGTLFLDEIGDMPLEVQAYLLRVLEEDTITRIGSHKTISVNIRVICATHKDLRQEVEEGRFRQDLFYRINGIDIFLPPLKERKEDIALLAEHFLRRHSRQINFTSEALNKLRDYSWPGNIRELRSTIERTILLCEEDTITVNDIQLPEPKKASPGVRSMFIKEKLGKTLTRETIFEKLNECHGNVSLAANCLQISRMTLYRKMKNKSQS
ncbi:MAG: Acetoin dehydrogenase operon transcriptional activator AcoR [Smithella sp. PtaU1.Bin162]|nr:MAG: Acetoin dehydrogenase operon transcriptional activator AcoR [Smithella sp. PtaU1.Bin162]